MRLIDGFVMYMQLFYGKTRGRKERNINKKCSFSKHTPLSMTKSKVSYAANVSFEKLVFDFENPRFLKSKKFVDERALLQWMLKNGDILELMHSLANIGYVRAEPLLVLKNKDTYTVIDGNRRLAAMKLLKDPSLAVLRKKTVAEISRKAVHRNFSSIPARIYESRNALLDYLAYKHIVGTKLWQARAKAEYLKGIFAEHKKDDAPSEEVYTYISQIVGINLSHVQQILETVALVELAEKNAFWKSFDLHERIEPHFSLLHTALLYENIRSYVEAEVSIDGSIQNCNAIHTKNLFEWICGKNKIVGTDDDLKRLNNIIVSSKALEMLENGASLDIAEDFSNNTLECFREYLQQAYEMLLKVDRLLTQVPKFSQKDQIQTRELAQLARKILKYVENAEDNCF